MEILRSNPGKSNYLRMIIGSERRNARAGIRFTGIILAQTGEEEAGWRNALRSAQATTSHSKGY
jgi:hypothetical protein